MIDTDNLRTASLYINNQLLSRGLLRDGQSIDFANPGKGEDAADTMGRIMSVVNDLILRRDRDAEQRESLSTTMRILRSENLKYTKDIAQLTEKATDAGRKLEIAESAESSLRTQLKSAEAVAKGLKDDLARTRNLVAQSRTACANDVRRRDRQIESLKKQVGEAGRARGSRSNPAITAIQVTGDHGDFKNTPSRNFSAAEAGYTLRDETNAFLASLVQNLNQENETILSTMHKTMTALREMSGWAADEKQNRHAIQRPTWDDMSQELHSVLDHMKTILTNPSFVPIEEVIVREEEIVRLKDGWVKMEDRWKEAVRLIEGWRTRMADTGKTVEDEELQMGLRLSPIRIRSSREVRPVSRLKLSPLTEDQNEDYRSDAESPCRSQRSSLSLVPADENPDVPEEQEAAEVYAGENGAAYDSDGFLADDYDIEESNIEVLQESVATRPQDKSPPSSPLPEPPQLSPLRDCYAAGNRGTLQTAKPRTRPEKLTTVTDARTRESQASLSDAPIPPPHRLQAMRPGLRATQATRSFTGTSLDDALLGTDHTPETVIHPEIENQSPQDRARHISPKSAGEPELPAQKTPSRLTRVVLPRPGETAAHQSPLTVANIAAKLAASEREADAARVRAKLKAARAAKKAVPVAAEESKGKQEIPVEKQSDLAREEGLSREGVPNQDSEVSVPEKRKRDRKVSNKASSRRRSTLSPWELESLITGKM